MILIKELMYNLDTGAIVENPQHVDIKDIQVPDLWHIAMTFDDPRIKATILSTWYLAHDVVNALRTVVDDLDEMNPKLEPRNLGDTI